MEEHSVTMYCPGVTGLQMLNIGLWRLQWAFAAGHQWEWLRDDNGLLDVEQWVEVASESIAAGLSDARPFHIAACPFII